MAEIRVGSLVIGHGNYKQVCRELKLPYEYFENVLGGRELQLSDDVAFYDIETDDAEKFLFGYVCDLNGRMERFDDAAAMCAALNGFDVVCAFNSFRFDNRILARLAPGEFDGRVVQGLGCDFLKNALNVDMLVMYRLWKPAVRSHKLEYLAVELGMEWEHLSLASYEEKDAKCKEDVEALRLFWPVCREMMGWYWSRFHLGPEFLGAMAPACMNRLRRWCLQIWALENGLVPVPFKKRSARKGRFYMRDAPGFYRDLRVHDVKSAYPATAVMLDCRLWGDVAGKGDFAAFESWLMDERKNNANIGDGIKWIGNALIGDMNFTDGELFDQGIMADVWNRFFGHMERWVSAIGVENVKYAYTDCVVVPAALNMPEFPVPEYGVAVKADFAWVVVWNIERMLGVTIQGEVVRKHFNRVPAQLRLYGALEQGIDGILLAGEKEALAFMEKPRNPLDMKTLPDTCFSITIRKDGDTCNSTDYLEIWPQLKMGFNEVYYGKGGKLVADRKKMDYRAYERLVKNYLALYKFKARAGRKVAKRSAVKHVKK